MWSVAFEKAFGNSARETSMTTSMVFVKEQIPKRRTLSLVRSFGACDHVRYIFSAVCGNQRVCFRFVALKEHEGEEGGYDVKEIFEKGRTDPRAFSWYVLNYMKKILPRQMNKSLKTCVPGELFTKDDETLLQWQIENSYDRWLDMKARGSKRSSPVPTLWTIAGNSGGSKKFGG